MASQKAINQFTLEIRYLEILQRLGFENRMDPEIVKWLHDTRPIEPDEDI